MPTDDVYDYLDQETMDSPNSRKKKTPKAELPQMISQPKLLSKSRVGQSAASKSSSGTRGLATSVYREDRRSKKYWHVADEAGVNRFKSHYGAASKPLGWTKEFRCCGESSIQHWIESWSRRTSRHLRRGTHFDHQGLFFLTSNLISFCFILLFIYIRSFQFIIPIVFTLCLWCFHLSSRTPILWKYWRIRLSLCLHHARLRKYIRMRI